MVTKVNPSVNLVDYGPKYRKADGSIVTSDEIIAEMSGITFKDIKSPYEAIANGGITPEQAPEILKKIIRSAGRGHASMTTSVNLWFSVEGDCSKFPDAMFTGATYASSLMSSSRRVPIELDSVVVPPSVLSAGQNAVDLYTRVSEANIRAYKTLMENGVEKEVAAKIVQYGHRGSGFMDMPLETLIGLEQYFRANPDMPQEGRDIVNQMVKAVRKNGMLFLYEARKAAARPGYVVNDIFHRRENEASAFLAEHPEVLDRPLILDVRAKMSPEFKARLAEYSEQLRKMQGASAEVLLENDSMQGLVELMSDFNDCLSVKTAVNTPWRVWGEVKRHRTLKQDTESIYHARARAMETLGVGGEQDTFFGEWTNKPQEVIHGFRQICSLPESIVKNNANLAIWQERFRDSLVASEKLVQMGVPESDAIYIIPRGLKQVVVKDFDLANIIGLYLPIRLCKTAEEEMGQLTAAERALMISDSRFPEEVKPLLVPKCGAAAYCLESKPCGKVQIANPGYTAEFHASLEALKVRKITEATKA